MSMNVETVASIDIDRILLELKKLPKYETQIGLQSVKGIDDPFYATGRITEKEHEETDFTEFLFDMPYLNSILKEHNVYRARVMKMKERTCYTYHQDLTKRLHIPLITNENCFLLLDKQAVHLPADGSVYIVDTTKFHTAINASLEDRIHIIGCLK